LTVQIDSRNYAEIAFPSIRLMNMDLRDVEYFAVVAQHGHVGRAAEALGLGQPALSMSLRRLEKSAQAKLVKRTPKGIELTAVGAALLSHVRRLRLARDDLARELADLAHGRAGHLRIGASPANAEGYLPDACRTLLMDAPKVTLNVTVLDNDALLPALKKGDLDMVVSHIEQFPYPELIKEPLWKDEFAVYAAANHRLAKRKSLSLAELVEERWASTATSAFGPLRSLHRAFEERGLPPPKNTLVSDSTMLRYRTVATSDLLGLSAKRLVQAAAPHLRLKILPVKDLNWTRPAAVAYRKDAYLSPAARRFIEILKAAARKVASRHPAAVDAHDAEQSLAADVPRAARR
jgi:DNA-binding transcriptional LysR family regulator